MSSKFFLVALLSLLFAGPFCLALPREVATDSDLIAIFQALTILARQTANPFLSTQQEQEVKDIFSNPDSNGAAKAGFEYLLQQRLKLVSPSVQKKIWNLYRKHIIRRTLTSDVAARHKSRFNGKGGLNEVIVYAPKSYWGTVIEYMILAHEFEHSIQEAQLRESLLVLHPEAGKMIDQILIETNSTYLWYLREIGAMQFEWHFIQLIPSELKKSLLTRMKNEYRDFITRGLSEDKKSAIEHVYSEQKAGRYSKSKFNQKIADENTDRKMGFSQAPTASSHTKIIYYSNTHSIEACDKLLKLGD